MGSSSAGIKLVEAENNEFSGNVIKFSNTNDQEAAIFVLDANDNKFYSNTISNNTGHGIHFSGTSTGNQFGAINSGNIVKDNSGWGVNFLVNTATGNPVASNQIYNNALGSIGNYTNITPINTPTLLAAYLNSSSTSSTLVLANVASVVHVTRTRYRPAVLVVTANWTALPTATVSPLSASV